MAYELGYRNQLSTTLSVDLAAFHNNYKDLRTVEVGAATVETTPALLHLSLPFNASNKLRAETYGGHAGMASVGMVAYPAVYTYLHMHLYTNRTTDPTAGNAKGENPAHQVSIRSPMSLPHNIELDL